MLLLSSTSWLRGRGVPLLRGSDTSTSILVKKKKKKRSALDPHERNDRRLEVDSQGDIDVLGNIMLVTWDKKSSAGYLFI